MRLLPGLRQYFKTKENLVYKMKVQKRRRGFIVEPQLSAEDQIFIAMTGIKVEDPNTLELPKKFRFPEWIPLKDYNYKPTLQEHPDYQHQVAYSFKDDTRLVEGLNQALVLTKTQPMDGLPQRVQERLGQVQIPGQNELAQRMIMQANLWMNNKERIKRHRLPDTPIGWKTKAEWGIPESKIVPSLLFNLTRMCETMTSRFPDMNQRWLSRQHPINSFYCYEDGKPISIGTTFPLMLCSERPLTRFADTHTVQATQDFRLPDLFPLSPMVDLKSTNMWRPVHDIGFEDTNGVHLHTAFQALLDYNPLESNPADQRCMRALLHCFSICLAQAKIRYGPDVSGVLSEPISTQHVAMDAFGTTYFTCFQLNTLDVSNEAGVKNIAWFDKDNFLYRKLIPKRSMLRNTRFVDFDPDVLETMITLYLTDVNIQESVQSAQSVKTNDKTPGEKE